MPSLIQVLRATKTKNLLLQACFLQVKYFAKIRLLSPTDTDGFHDSPVDSCIVLFF